MEPLGFDGGNKVAAKIAKLDPEGRYVRLNLVTHSVEYSREFEFGEEISDFTGEEEICRAFIVCWLCTIGGYLPNCIALESRYSIGRPKTGAELDILLRRVDGLAYALIEVKAPLDYTVDQDSFIKGQLFNIAPHEEGTSVLSFATVQIRHAGPEIVCKTIDYKTYRRFEDWVLSRAFSNQIPTNYGEPEHVYLVNGGPRDLRPATGVPELTRIRKRLHDVLWRGATPDNTIYAYVVKIFLAKTHDEKTTNRGTRYRLQIKYPGNKREPSSQTFQNVSDLYKAAYRKYMGLSEDAAVDGLNETEFSPEQTAFVVEIIQKLSLVKTTQANLDILGRFFEGITRDGFKQSKGLFFTHQNIVSFMIYVLDVIGLVDRKIKSDRLATEKLPYIIDPACGSGTFLLSAMNHITDHVIATAETLMTNDDVKEFVAAHFPNGQENLWAKDFLYGLDATEVLALSAKVNMLLRRDGQAHIYHSDGLSPLPSYKETRLRGTTHRVRI